MTEIEKDKQTIGIIALLYQWTVGIVKNKRKRHQILFHLGPYWMDGPTVHFGLWNYCFKHITQTYSDKCYKVTDVEDDAITIDGM